MGKLKVKIYGAKDLSFKDAEGWFDPSCTVEIKDQTVTLKHSKFKSPREKNQNIVWDKSVLFTDLPDEEVASSSSSKSLFSFSQKKKQTPPTLTLTIRIYDRISEDCEEILGWVAIPLKELTRGKTITEWYDLRDGTGSVKIGLTAVDFGTIDPEKLPSEQSVEQMRKACPAPKLGQIQKSELLKTKLFQPPGKKQKFRMIDPGDIKRKALIGKGTFGLVYKGKLKDQDGVVCIKDMSASSSSRIIEEWKREAELMRYTDCRYVCRVFGYSFISTDLTIVMEFCERGSLYDVLYKKPPKSLGSSLTKLLRGDKSGDIKNFSIVQRLRMARHCVRGLTYLHQNQVVHCDLKSPNILVTQDYTCKLTDFGCAKLNNDFTRDTRGIGSPLWAAPETKHSQCTFAADVYSMGLVLYEIFEHSLPKWHRKKKIAVVPDQYDGMQVISPCLSEDPALRPSASALLRSLDAWVSQILSDLYSSLDADLKKQIGLIGEAMNGETENNKDAEMNNLYNYLIKKVKISDIANKINELQITPEAPLDSPSHSMSHSMGLEEHSLEQLVEEVDD